MSHLVPCRKLRSATAACDLLSNMSRVAGDKEGIVQRQILGKLDSVLHHFSREMHAASDVFHAHKVALRPLKPLRDSYKLLCRFGLD